MGDTDIKKHLKKYLGWKMQVEKNQERIARAKSAERFPSMREGDGSKHQPGSGDRMTSAIHRRMDLEAKLLPTIIDALDKMEEVERAINSLDDPLEQEVLTCRYIDGEWSEEEQRGYYRPMPWSEVALCIYGSDDENCQKAATRLHGRALVSVEKALWGKEKSHL